MCKVNINILFGVLRVDRWKSVNKNTELRSLTKGTIPLISIPRFVHPGHAAGVSR